MALGLTQEKQPKSVIQERVDKAIQMLDLADYAERRPSDLSGGQRQRLSLIHI